MGAPAGVYRLIEQFDERPPKNETEARTQFVDPFFGALGWDVRDNRQVSLEPTVAVQVGGITKPKRPDYAFHIGKQTHFFVEAKHPPRKSGDEYRARLSVAALWLVVRYAGRHPHRL